MAKRRNLKVQLPNWFTRMFPDAIWRMPSDEKAVYLTFDDGPIPSVTTEVLEILNDYNIKATFFCVGENAYRNPEVFKQIIDDGHAVGNHTFNHLQGIKYSDQYYLKNIEKAGDIIGSNLFRPPHGLMRRSQYQKLSNLYTIVMWDVISCDYDQNITPDQCFHNVVDFVRNGSIITFHDSLKAEQNVLSTLPRVIEYLKAEGYVFKKIEFPKTKPLYNTPWLQRVKEMRQQQRRWA